MMRRLATVALLSVPAVAAGGGFPPGSACAALAAVDPASAYQQLAAVAAADLPALDGRTFVVEVADPVADRFASEIPEPGRHRLTYRMGRNHVTEGWNWHPEADPAREDYYRYKYLPLGERETATAAPQEVIDPAVGHYTIHFQRRDAYYFAFDNPYDFYPRNDDDDGFAIETAAPDEHFVLVARGHHAPPMRAESTTYWRADPARRVDLTLKNRYFMGHLETLWFCSDDGRILGQLGSVDR